MSTEPLQRRIPEPQSLCVPPYGASGRHSISEVFSSRSNNYNMLCLEKTCLWPSIKTPKKGHKHKKQYMYCVLYFPIDFQLTSGCCSFCKKSNVWYHPYSPIDYWWLIIALYNSEVVRSLCTWAVTWNLNKGLQIPLCMFLSHFLLPSFLQKSQQVEGQEISII